MSIYISIPTFVDNQLEFTIKDAISMADNPNDISIGLCFMEINRETEYTNLFFNTKILPLIEDKRIRFKHFKVGEYVPSVGFGRNAALSMYEGEDYILQIDSHTKFEKGWDSKIIKMFKEALEETQNEKTVLTAYLGDYTHTNKEGRSLNYNQPIAKYPIMLPDFWNELPIPKWGDFSLRQPPYMRDELYLPCIKFNAQFAFSNKLFYDEYGLPEDIIFWEEEIVQTMNLLYSGFSLVFPNQILPLTHLYFNDISHDVNDINYRVSGANPRDLDGKAYFEGVADSYNRFIEDPANVEKIKKFHKYTRVHPKYGAFKDGYIPKQYNY
jgi:hypothetical protein